MQLKGLAKHVAGQLCEQAASEASFWEKGTHATLPVMAAILLS